MNTNCIKSKIVCGFLLNNGEYIYSLYQPFFNRNVYVFHVEDKPEIILFKLTDMVEKCNTVLSYIYSKIKKNYDKLENHIYQAEDILNKKVENYESEYFITIKTNSIFLTFYGCEILYKLFNPEYTFSTLTLNKRKTIEKTLHPNKLRKILLKNKTSTSTSTSTQIDNQSNTNMYSYEDLLRIIKYQEDIIDRKDTQVQQLQELCKTYINDMNMFVQYTYNNHCEQYIHHLNNMNALYKKFFEPVLNLQTNNEN